MCLAVIKLMEELGSASASPMPALYLVSSEAGTLYERVIRAQGKPLRERIRSALSFELDILTIEIWIIGYRLGRFASTYSLTIPPICLITWNETRGQCKLKRSSSPVTGHCASTTRKSLSSAYLLGVSCASVRSNKKLQGLLSLRRGQYLEDS